MEEMRIEIPLGEYKELIRTAEKAELLREICAAEPYMVSAYARKLFGIPAPDDQKDEGKA